MRHYAIIISILLFAGTAFSQQETPEPAGFPSLISSIRISPPLDFCGEKTPIRESEIRERMEKELLLFLWDRAQVILWMKRSGRYLPYIEKVLKQNGMPDDLKYVAIVESALLPHIGSSKGAVGYWQFIPSTGRRYGLRIDSHIDERRNFFIATQAAVRYLKKLYADFGSWTLAAAAYNMGEHGLDKRIAEQKTRDYYHLYLPLETQRYIYKILAAKLVLTDPRRFGFNLTSSDIYAPVRFDQVQLDLPDSVPVMSIAEAAGTYFRTIKDLNPQIRGNQLVAGRHYVLLPKGTEKKFSARFKRILAELPKPKAKSPGNRRTYVVKGGDTLTGIAARHRVKLSDLLRWNRLKIDTPIHKGQRLAIYK